MQIASEHGEGVGVPLAYLSLGKMAMAQPTAVPEKSLQCEVEAHAGT
jgi:hypothetical protein